MEELLINDVIKTMKKYFWVILIFTILGGIVGRIMMPEAANPTYEASSVVLLDPKVEEDNGGTKPIEDDGRFFNTAQTLINTPVILDPVIEGLNRDTTIKDLSNRVKVTIENNSQILRITVSDSSAEQATKIANKIVEVYSKEIHNYLDVEMVKIIEKAKKGAEDEIIFARPKANMMMGILIGLVLGTFAAFILNKFSNSIKLTR
jgi:capsular polysaccharide biosynthesis protein